MTEPARWFVFGAGAQGRVTLDLLRAAGIRDSVSIDDNRSRVGRLDAGLRVYGRDWLREIDPCEWRAIVAIGRNDTRLRVAGELAESGVRFGVAVHPAATIATSAMVCDGTAIMAGVIVNTGAAIGSHVILNTRIVVEHDCVIGDGASLSPGVVMGGRVMIGRGAFIGVGAVLCPRVVVGDGAIVGAGSVVTRDVPAGVVAYGTPAKAIRPVAPDADWPKLM
jgi:sugar O-acyltransferase (sialic acid O-acetyltransferase NeuD family)